MGTKELEYDISKKWVRENCLEAYKESIIKECIEVVKQTPTHCAFTTYDLGTVKCTIDKSVELLQQHFNIK